MRRLRKEHRPRLLMMPLLDVVFILLIFFLVTATFVRETGVTVTRPQASQAETLEPSSMRVSVTASGDVYAEGRLVTLEELRRKVACQPSEVRLLWWQSRQNRDTCPPSSHH